MNDKCVQQDEITALEIIYNRRLDELAKRVVALESCVARIDERVASQLDVARRMEAAVTSEMARVAKIDADREKDNRNHWRRTFVAALLCRGYTPSDAIKTAGHALAQIEELEESESQDKGKK